MNIRPDQSMANLRGDLGGANEQSYVIPTTIDGTYEVQRVLHPAVASMAQGAFYKLTDYAGTTFAVWFDIDANGTEPNGPIYTACDVKIEVNVATGDLAPAVATAAKAAIDAEVLFVGFTNVKSSATLDFTSTIKHDLAAPASYVEAETAGPFTVSTVTAGVQPTVNGKYFTARNASTGFYYWFTNNGVGVDPEVADHTSKVIALTGNESQAGFIAAIEAVVEGSTGLTANAEGDKVYISVDSGGPVTDLGAGTSGFTVQVQSQGYSQSYAPGMNLGDDSVEPSAIS